MSNEFLFLFFVFFCEIWNLNLIWELIYVNKSSSKEKPKKKKKKDEKEQKEQPGPKRSLEGLENVRVIQKNLVYVSNLPQKYLNEQVTIFLIDK